MLELALSGLLCGVLLKGFLDRRMYKMLLYDATRTSNDLQDQIDELEREVRYLESISPVKQRASKGPANIQTSARMDELVKQFQKMGLNAAEASAKMAEFLAPVVEEEMLLKQQGITMVIQEEPEL